MHGRLGEKPSDDLRDRAGLAEWLSAFGLEPPPTAADVALLRQCQAARCGPLYVDTSRGHRRRWCSSETCGNRARVTAHRRRHPPVS